MDAMMFGITEYDPNAEEIIKTIKSKRLTKHSKTIISLAR